MYVAFAFVALLVLATKALKMSIPHNKIDPVSYK